MNDRFNFFLPLSKVDKTAEGHRIITGYASTPALDLDGEIISIDAVKGALPGYMEWRNIRQMHQPIAVGIAKEATVDEKGLYLTGKIVDANAIKLLDEGVLKGLSIGGKKLSKRGNVVTEIDLIEISLVDRPANGECRIDAVKSASGGFTLYGPDPARADAAEESETSWFRKTFERIVFGDEAKFARKPTTFLDFEAAGHGEEGAYGDASYEALCKRQFSPKERGDAESKGEAMPGGGYPIKSEQDVKNAVQAFGRAKDKEATKKHITRRAKSVGAEHHLPADWEGSTKEKAAAADPELDDLIKFFSANDDDATPKTTAFAKSGDSASLLLPDVRDRLAKGCGVVADLAYAFSSIRAAQRRLIAEGFVEKDGDDHTLATKLGEIASELATVMAQKATHEGSEAAYLTDADDILSYELGQGVFLMNSQTTDLAKKARDEEALKVALGKAHGHVNKAGKSNASAMDCMGKLGKMFAEAAKKGAEATKAGKVPEGLDLKAAFGLVKAAFGAAGEANDHMEMAGLALANLSNGTVVGSHGVTAVSEGTRTEGEVPWYDSDEPYRGRESAAEPFAGKAANGGAPEGFVSKREADLMAENAALNARVETLGKQPGGAFKARTVLAPVGGEQGDDMSILMKGVVGVDANDPESRREAAGAMIGNMIANSGRFGKSVFDPTFRGQAGVKRASS